MGCFDSCKNREKQVDGFGGKNISWLGGYAIMISNQTGPAMVTIPLVYQLSGWLLPSMAFILVGVLTYFASTFLCEAMACIPGNNNFQGRIEFSTLARFFLGKRGHIIAQIFINASLQCLNIASIIISAQVMDDCIIAIFKRSCGIAIHPDPGWMCVIREGTGVSPFDGNIMFITAGYLVTLAFVIPMGLLNLDDNVYIQVFALFFLVVVITNWIVTFFLAGLSYSAVPVIGKDISNVMGNVIFNYGFITTVPSWVNEKKPGVGVNSTLWSSVLTSCTIFIVIGWGGSMAYFFPPGSDLLSVIVTSPQSNIFDLVMLYLFPPVIISLTIPVFSIVVRYNLLQNKVCGRAWANFFAVILPWIVVIPFMTGEGLMMVINWGSLFFTSIANFILPYILFIYATKFRANWENGCVLLTEDQKMILDEMKMEKESPEQVESTIPVNISVTEDSPLLKHWDTERGQKQQFSKFSYQALAAGEETSKKIAYISAFVLLSLVLVTVVSDLVFLIVYGDTDIGGL